MDAPAEEPAGDPRTNVPPMSRQKAFIVENAGILDVETKKAILRYVMMEVGRAAPCRDGGEPELRPVVLEQGVTKEISIDLDNIDSAEVVQTLFNIVSNRRASLNEPARDVSKI